MFTVFLQAILLYGLVNASSIIGDGEKRLEYAVALTTIPPRFRTVHHTLLSWIKQDIQPRRIVVFLPRRYKRFKGRTPISSSASYRNQLLEHLNQANLTEYIDGGLIQIVAVEEDWGPITKFVGSALYNTLGNHVQAKYWIYCDDDVAYKPELSTHYAALITSAPQMLKDFEAILSSDEHQFTERIHHAQEAHSLFGFTMFAAEHRIHVRRTSTHHAEGVPHIQGVDTYIIPSSIFDILRGTGTVPSPSNIITETMKTTDRILQLIKHFHTQLCPESFYQDDYLVSYILHFLGVRMYSARYHHLLCALDLYNGRSNGVDQTIVSHNGAEVPAPSNALGIDCTAVRNMVVSIEGVSKANFQMHMKEEVFTREFVTQQCLAGYASEAYAMLQQ